MTCTSRQGQCPQIARFSNRNCSRHELRNRHLRTMPRRQTNSPPSHEPAKRAKRPGELVHSDLCGPITPPSVGGHKYAGTFTDDATRMTVIIPLKTKTAAELLERFKEYKEEVEKVYKIQRLRTDGGGEYKNVFRSYLRKNGIKHETTAPYSPEQNGVSERVNRTVIERTKAILADSKLPKELWMEIASTVVYLKNRSPTRALKNITPYEAWYNEKPDLSHLCIIGTTAYIHIPKELRKKLDFNAKIGMLVGYEGRNQYRLWILSRRMSLYLVMLYSMRKSSPSQSYKSQKNKCKTPSSFNSRNRKQLGNQAPQLKHHQNRNRNLMTTTILMTK